MYSSEQMTPLRHSWPGYLIGFGLGGFFDGILLHQILQWHHLLSGLESARYNVRFLILTDGLFHLLMYVVTIAGLWMLWRDQRSGSNPGGNGRLVPCAMVGFGLWHVIDAVLSHWVLGIHRIRMDVSNPLVWDVLWVVVFGLVPILFGWLNSWRSDARSRSTTLPLILAAIVGGIFSAFPAADEEFVMVVFQSDTSGAEAMAAIGAIDGRFVWHDPTGQVWLFQSGPDGNVLKLYGQGALWVGNSVLPAGCFDYIRKG